MLSAFAVCGFPVSAPAASLTRGPYLQLLTPTTVTVVWNTDTAASCAVTIHPVGGSNRTVTGGSGKVCAVTVDNLTSGTPYGYVPKAGSAALTGESIFRAGDPTRAFTLLVVGDTGSGDGSQNAIANRMAATPADIMLHTGDMIYDDGAASDFNPKFFTPYAALLRTLVFWPCLGNHDVRTSNGAPWRDAFYTPANNAAHDEGYYSFAHGNAHFVTLNSNASTSPGSAQYVFLDQDLAASGARWKFVAFHHTIYSSGSSHGSNLTIRNNLIPLFDKYHVDIVFMGHEHDYERTKSLNGNQVVADGAGTVYITTGGGGKELYNVGKSSFTAYSESVHHFTRVAINGGQLTGSMIRDDGVVRDSFALTKGGGGTGPCTADVQCNDDDICSVDTCNPAQGCQHAVVDLDRIASTIGSALTQGTCAADTLPVSLGKTVARAQTLIDQAKTAPGDLQLRRLARRAAQRLRGAARLAARAGKRGKVSPDCANALHTALTKAADQDACRSRRE